jgi:hypothetical protein
MRPFDGVALIPTPVKTAEVVQKGTMPPGPPDLRSRSLIERSVWSSGESSASSKTLPAHVKRIAQFLSPRLMTSLLWPNRER